MADDLLIQSLRGGLNDEDLPAGLGQDEAAVATNVEFYYSTLGERRLGCAPISLTSAGFSSDEVILRLAERYIGNVVTDPEQWALATTLDGDGIRFARRYRSTWVAVTPVDEATPQLPDAYLSGLQSLNNKMFIPYNSQVDRLHVWDGVRLRRTGLAQPIAGPVTTNTGSGTYTGTRYFRVRFTERDANGITIRRSEPSDAVTFAPSGSGSGALLTKPPTISEFETHWEIEASLDNANFFRITTVAVGTTTYTDSTDPATTSYASLGPASETVGAYLLQQSAKYLAADDNRLLTAGHQSDPALRCRVAWSPVYADPGAGNDERLPLATGGDNYVDLNNYDGGEVTGMVQAAFGVIYVFKWGAVYRLTRTGDISHAYDPVRITNTRGAIPGSVVLGADERGNPCVYFLDPDVGFCSVGVSGIRDLAGLRNTWKRATISDGGMVCCSVYYPAKHQVKWWFPVDGNTLPNMMVTLQTDRIRQRDDGTTRGCWSLGDGIQATATAACVWHENTIEDGIERFRGRPFIGLRESQVSAAYMIQRSDVGDYDSGYAYRATLRSRPYYLAGLLNRCGTMVCALLATASATATLVGSCIRDFGKEQIEVDIDLVPSDAAEEYVVKLLDDLFMSEATVLQYQFADNPYVVDDEEIGMGEIELGGLNRTGIGYRTDDEYLIPEWRLGTIDWDTLPDGWSWKLYTWENVEKGTGESVTPVLRNAAGDEIWRGSAQTAVLTDADILAGGGLQTVTLTPGVGRVTYVGYAGVASATNADVFQWMKLVPEFTS